MGLAQVKRAYIASHKGCIARNVPRILNIDKNVAIVGYAEVNQQATSVMGRVKTHKGFFYCSSTEIEDGDLILDRQDDRYYLVMSAKAETFNYEVIYIDSTLFFCDSVVTVSRFGGGAKDAFGRPLTAAPAVVATDVRCLASVQNYDTLQQEDRLLAHDKLKFYMQAKVGVKVADRLTSASGKHYVVQSVDDLSLTNLVLLSVDTDVR